MSVKHFDCDDEYFEGDYVEYDDYENITFWSNGCSMGYVYCEGDDDFGI